MTAEPVSPTPRKAMGVATKVNILARQHRCCAACGSSLVLLSFEDGRAVIYLPMQFDHILPLELAGADSERNLQALCIPCHKIKTREDLKRIAKARRLRKKADPSTRKAKRPIPSRSLTSATRKRRFDGKVVER